MKNFDANILCAARDKNITARAAACVWREFFIKKLYRTLSRACIIKEKESLSLVWKLTRGIIKIVSIFIALLWFGLSGNIYICVRTREMKIEPTVYLALDGIIILFL